jgi:hypothetical protein
MRTTIALAFVAALALAGCANHAITPPLDAATTGPIVTGKLSGETATTAIPFSAYASGSPVIATEAFVESVAAAGAKPTAANAWTAPQTFSAAATNARGAIELSSTNPQLGFQYSGNDAKADNKRWNFITWGTTFSVRALDDRGNAGIAGVSFHRTGKDITDVAFPAAVQFGAAITAAAAYTPTTDQSLTTKKYVDAKVAALTAQIAALMAKLRAAGLLAP